MQSARGSRSQGGAAAEAHADLLIVGGGTGGCAAALAATSLGLQVVMTEETDWIGGQLTSQMVPRMRAHGSRGKAVRRAIAAIGTLSGSTIATTTR